MTQCLVQNLIPPHFATGNHSAIYLGKRQRTMADDEGRSLPPLPDFEASRQSDGQNTIRLPPISSLFAREQDVWRGTSSAPPQTTRYNVSRSVFKEDKEPGQRHKPHLDFSTEHHRTSPSDPTVSVREGRQADIQGPRQPTILPSIRQLALHEPLTPQRKSPAPSEYTGPCAPVYEQGAQATSMRHSWADHEKTTQLTSIWEQIRDFSRSRNVPLIDASKSIAHHPEQAVRVSYLLDSIDMELAQIARFEGRSVAQQIAHAHGLTPYRGSPDAMPPSALPPPRIHSPDSFSDDLSIQSAEQEDSLRRQHTPDIRMPRHSSFSGGRSPLMPSPSLTASSTSTSHSPGVSVANQLSGMSVAAGPEGWHRAPAEGEKILDTKTSTAARKSKAKRRVTKREGEAPACLSCGTLSTAEWRRGPTGPRTLCNACGLLFAKMARMRQAEHHRSSGSGVTVGGKPSLSPSSASTSSIPDPTLDELRKAFVTSSKSHPRFSPSSRMSTATSGAADPTGPGLKQPHHMSFVGPEWGNQECQGSASGVGHRGFSARAGPDEAIDSKHRLFEASNRATMAERSSSSDSWGGRGKVRRIDSERRDVGRFGEPFDHSR